MSSRYERRRDYDDRDRGGRYDPPPRRREGRSRSRSPPRRERDRRGPDRRDYGRDDRRDRDRRDDRPRDDRDRREHYRDDRRDGRDDRRDPQKRDERDGPGDRDNVRERDGVRPRGDEKKYEGENKPGRDVVGPSVPSGSKPRDDSAAPEEGEEGETMDAVNDDDAAMMAMMGMSGFGTTKGKHVEGNQEGASDVKKIRTWRQYMNRRGGFNRPLDKIK